MKANGCRLEKVNKREMRGSHKRGSYQRDLRPAECQGFLFEPNVFAVFAATFPVFSRGLRQFCYKEIPGEPFPGFKEEVPEGRP